jgi:hypothetical protein
MAVVLASIIAVFGTLGGVTASHVVQGKIGERNESIARDERLRQERLAAYNSFAGAVMDLRRAQYDRWHRRRSEEYQRDPEGVRAKSSRLRSTAWSAFYRFKLTSNDEELTSLAKQAVEAAAHVYDARNSADLQKRSERARACIDDFITSAACYLESTDSRKAHSGRKAEDSAI